ncbi:ATP-citrate synthase beta chain protein 2 [Tanacetum coccineum]
MRTRRSGRTSPLAYDPEVERSARLRRKAVRHFSTNLDFAGLEELFTEILASEKAMAFRGEEGMMKKAVALGLVPAIRSGEKQPHMYRTSGDRQRVLSSDKKNMKSKHTDSNLQCGFMKNVFLTLVTYRETPSVAGIINSGAEGFQKLFFGQEEIAIPIHSTIEAACAAHPTADVFINFASFRSAAASSKLALKQPTIRVLAIIAEGVPESDTKELISYARSNNKTVVHKDWEFARRLGHKGIPRLNANIMKSLFGCDQGATGKKEDGYVTVLTNNRRTIISSGEGTQRRNFEEDISWCRQVP